MGASQILGTWLLKTRLFGSRTYSDPVSFFPDDEIAKASIFFVIFWSSTLTGANLLRTLVVGIFFGLDDSERTWRTW